MSIKRVIRILTGLVVASSALVAVDYYQLGYLEAVPLGFLAGMLGGILAIGGED